MASIVLDASVVLKWYLADEPHRRQALALRERIVAGDLELVAPAHLPLEISAGLVRAMQRGRLDSGFLVPAIEALRQLESTLVELMDVAVDATALAVALRVRPYDAAYLVVARRISAPLVTADRPLYDAAFAAGHNSIWLGDVP